jgi:hypothetical protein
MQTINIFGKEFTTIASLKASQWIEAVESFMKVKAESIAMAVDAEKASQQAATTIETVVLAAGAIVVAAITSEAAVTIYRRTLKVLVFSIVLVLMLTGKLAQWCWEHRSDTAVYHWLRAAISSRSGLRVRTELLGASLVLSLWVDRYHQQVDRLLNRLGLGGFSIEVQ